MTISHFVAGSPPNANFDVVPRIKWIGTTQEKMSGESITELNIIMRIAKQGGK